MAVFPKLHNEATVQVEDKTRLDATPSFVSADDTGITQVRIDPETGVAGFIDVTSKKYLDWAYDTNGTKTITVEVTGSTGTNTKTFDVEVLTAAEDCLFSDDSMLLPYEGEILKYVRKGRCSWLDKHRAAQERIIEFLDEKKIWKPCDDNDADQYAGVPVPYTKADICALTGDDFEQFKDWSKFMVLEMIYSDLSKQVDDIFARKAESYRGMKDAAAHRGCLRLDKDGDGEIECGDFEDLQSGDLVRR